MRAVEPVPDISASRLRTFLAVVRTGSVRAAAAELHVTEPAVSTAIGQLARQLGAELFTREGRGLRITSAGEVVLPPVLAGFRRRFPHIVLGVTIAPRDELFDHLRHHEVDVVIGGRPPHGSNLRLRASRENTLVVVGAPGVSDDLARTTWLMRGRGSGLLDTTLGLLNRLDLDPPQLTLGTHGAVVASARAGLGITLVHADAVADDLARGSLVTLDVPRTPMRRPWVVASTDSPVPSARLLIAHLTDAAVMGSGVFHPVNRPAG